MIWGRGEGGMEGGRTVRDPKLGEFGGSPSECDDFDDEDEKDGEEADA